VAAEAEGLRPIREIYADRTYTDRFTLTPRSRPDAMIHNPAEALARIIRFVGEGRIEAQGGATLAVPIESVCVHGDGPAAVAMARALRAGLVAAGWRVASALAD
jgi:UPF0271 protein